jgi:hypothetical protein
MKPDPEQLIEQLVANTRKLLTDHWGRAEQVFAATNIKIGITHLIDFDGAKATAKSTISFGARVKDTVEVTIDDSQPELGLHTVGETHNGEANEFLA